MAVLKSTKWRKFTRGSIHQLREPETGNQKVLTVGTDTDPIIAAVVDSIYCKLTATATAGTRKLLLTRKDAAGNVTAKWQSGTAAEVIANETKEITFWRDGGSLGAYNGQEQTDVHLAPLPAAFVLVDGDELTIEDLTAVDVADVLEVCVRLNASLGF
jgi:hypothetical protein